MKSSRIFLAAGRTQLTELVCLGVIALLPLAPLFAPDGCFGLDWTSHLWMTAYYAEYFKQHAAFPEVMNATQLTGMPIPLFYGVLLYPYLGALGAVVGAAWAMRAAVAAVFLLQAWQVFRLMLLAGRDRGVAWVAAAATSWSIYALTNLYSRGAFAELIAVALLTAAIGALGRVFLLPAAQRRGFDGLSGLLYFVLAAGAHPITALCGGLFVALLAAVFFLLGEKRAQVAWWGLAGAVATAVVLLPWIYVAAKFGPDLLVSQTDSKALSYLEVDSLGSRLMPLPYDSRLAGNEALPLGQSPHLDVQVSTGLLLLALFLSGCAGLAGGRRAQLPRQGWWVMGIFWALFLCLLALSVNPALGAAILPARNIQYAYRLVSYLNLSLLVIVAGGLLAFAPAGWPDRLGNWRKAILLSVLGISVLGLFIKLRHAAEGAYVISDMAGPRVAQLPRGYMGWHGYAVFNAPKAADSPATILKVPVGVAADFGEAHPFQVELATAGPVEIGVQPFPWNEVRVDGRSVMAAPGVWQRDKGIILLMAAGRHDIHYAWNPDLLWRGMNRLSRAVLFLWVVTMAGFGVRRVFRRQAPAG